MSENDEENTKDILEESKEANNNTEKDLSSKKKEEEPQLPVSDSPQSVPFHSLGASFAASDHEVPNTVARTPFAVANQTVERVEHEYKVEEGLVSGGNSGFLKSKKEAKLIKALLGIRVIGLMLCLISFAVMGADRNKRTYELYSSYSSYSSYQYIYLDYSFYKIMEFQLVLAVNVIGFVYCGVQIWDLLNYIFTNNHLLNHYSLRYFTFAMDQVLAYLLLATSASCATATRYFSKSSESAVEFITMGHASIVISFLAFKAFALATILSAYMLFKFNN